MDQKKIIKHIRCKLYGIQYFATPQGILDLAHILPIVWYHCEFPLTNSDTLGEALAWCAEGGRILEEVQHNRGRGTSTIQVKYDYLSEVEETSNSLGELDLLYFLNKYNGDSSIVGASAADVGDITR